MALMETSHCHTNQVKSLLQHFYTKDSVRPDQWTRPLAEKNKKRGFRTKYGPDTDHYRPLPISLSLEEFASHHYSSLLPLDPIQYSQSSTSNLSTTWSLSNSSPDMDNEGLLDWTSDFRSFSPSSSSFAPTTTPYHHTPCPFLDHHQKRDQHTFISYPPTLVPTNTHFIKNDDESKSWEMAFDWYENNISSTNNNSNDISTRHIHSDKDISVDHNPAESDQQDNSRDKDRTALDWTRMGMELQELDQDKTAIDAFRNALDLDSTILDAWLGLAISYANEHERGKVYDCLESWLDNHRTYRHLYTSTMMKDRHTILVDRFLVAARCAPGGSDDASRLIEMDADIQVILGLLFHLADDTMKSRDCFRAALACRPEDHRLWNQLGSILMAQPTLYACAMDMYLNALDLNPHYIRARYNVAILHMKMAQYEEAAHHLTIALYQQSSSRCPTVSSSPMWSSLRLVMYMLNLDHLANACNQYDLKPFEPFLKGDKNSIDL